MKKKTVLESLKYFLQNVQNVFSIFISFSIENEKKTNPPLCPPLRPPPLPPILGGSSAAIPLKIWDVMPPYLKTFFG